MTKSNETGRSLNEEQFAKLFSIYTSQLVMTMQGVSQFEKKISGYVLMILGAAVMIIALAIKLSLFGIQTAALNPTEFMTIVLAGLVLILVGTFLRFYQYMAEQETAQELISAGLHLLIKH